MDAGTAKGDDTVMNGTPEPDRNDQDALWRIAVALNRAAAAVTARRPLSPLLFFTDPVRTPRPWETAARLPSGAGVVHRGFGRPEAEDEARRLADIARARGLILLIGQDAELADAVEAHGVHLPEQQRQRAAELRAARPDWILTAALHADGMAGLDQLAIQALDAVVVSPVFPAGGSSAPRPALGVEKTRCLAAHLPLPAYGLGGITAASAPILAESGLCGLAAVSAVVDAYGPAPGG